MNPRSSRHITLEFVAATWKGFQDPVPMLPFCSSWAWSMTAIS